MTAEEVRKALRGRYETDSNNSAMVGRWTCINEWRGIDLLALDAWREASVVGHEIKCSRSDYRRELLRPHKRRDAVAMCTSFYMVVPDGLLTQEEIDFKEPEWSDSDFIRTPCDGMDEILWPGNRRFVTVGGGNCRKYRDGSRWARRHMDTGYLVNLPVPAVLRRTHQRYVDGEPADDPIPDYELRRMVEEQGYRHERCPTCKGSGHNGLSRVEREAPTLWVPRDVGLITVDGRGCTIVRRAPKNKDPRPIATSRQQINDLVRWTSHRPDPRHR